MPGEKELWGVIFGRDFGGVILVTDSRGPGVRENF